jgi:Tfp pilus assembly major pilin PilA
MKASKSAVFLFELMVIILVFTIAAAICTSIFAEAYNMSEESENLTMAAIKAQTTAEEFKTEDLVAEDFYDENWNLATKSNYKYSVSVEDVKNSDGISSANVVVYKVDDKKQESIFSIPVSKFVS